MEEKTKFKQCEKCKGYIPEHWKKHSKCGWNVTEEVPETKQKEEFVTNGVQQVEILSFTEPKQLTNAINMFCKEKKVFAIQYKPLITGNETYTTIHNAMIFYWP